MDPFYVQHASASGYKAAEACRKAGAMILNGHEHAYYRSKPIARYSFQEVTRLLVARAVECS